jgi:hypothetical protein
MEGAVRWLDSAEVRLRGHVAKPKPRPTAPAVAEDTGLAVGRRATRRQGVRP